ncbi:MAG: ribokinase [Phycisphaerae bacterium]|jgi:ribokinase
MSRAITIIGSINIDLVAVASRLPREGETVLAHDYRVVCGGKGANQAVAAARLGGRVQMVGCVGDDEYGRVAKSNLAAHGVGVRAVRTIAGAHTGVALIVVDDRGRNLIAVAPNANARLRVPRRPFDIAVMQLETPYSPPRAKLFILNPAPARLDVLEQTTPRSKRILRGVDLVVPNEHEAEALTGRRDPARAAAELLRLGARQALITLGAEGVFDGGCSRGAVPVVNDGRPRHHPAFPMRATDTVGAGDAFIGALAAALAEGHADPIRFAQAAAALKCARCGAQSVPTRRDVERLIARR